MYNRGTVAEIIWLQSVVKWVYKTELGSRMSEKVRRPIHSKQRVNAQQIASRLADNKTRATEHLS